MHTLRIWAKVKAGKKPFNYVSGKDTAPDSVGRAVRKVSGRTSNKMSTGVSYSFAPSTQVNLL